MVSLPSHLGLRNHEALVEKAGSTLENIRERQMIEALGQCQV